jgi:hypothetical protein
MFVPVIIPTQDASPHARELGRRIAALIRDYRLQHEDASSTDVHFALRIAAEETGGFGRGRRMALIAGVLVAGMLASVVFIAHSGRSEPALPMLAIAGFIAVILVALIVLKSRLG